jgi:hypothetical protein
MLSNHVKDTVDKRHVWQSIEAAANGALTFAYAAYGDQEGNYPPEIFSPYLPYSLLQAAIVYHRLWIQTGQTEYQHGKGLLRAIIKNIAFRWMAAGKSE